MGYTLYLVCYRRVYSRLLILRVLLIGSAKYFQARRTVSAHTGICGAIFVSTVMRTIEYTTTIVPTLAVCPWRWILL